MRVPGRWPIEGIDGAVARIGRSLDDPAVGMFVLSGPAGIGKTALAVAVAEAETARRSVRRVVASGALADRPFGAFGPLVAGELSPAAIAELLTSGDEPGEEVAARGLLVVDDAPLLDPTSAEHVAAAVRSGRIVVLATARGGHALPAALDGLAVEDRVVTEVLEPLDRRTIGRAAAGALGRRLHPEALTTLVERSGGVPLHARELVFANVAARRLIESDDGWAVDGDWIAPATLFELVSSRFLLLDDRGRRSVEALCLTQPLSVDAASNLVGADALADLERAGLVVVADERDRPSVRLAHPLYEESVRAGLAPLRRRAIAEEAVAALATAADADADLALRMACLRIDNDLPIEADQAMAAAQRSLGMLDPVLAERLVLACAIRDARTLLLLGAALAAQGRTADADDVLAEAWELAATDEERGRILSRRAGNLGPGAGRFADAVALVEDGLTMVDDPEWRGFLEADLAMLRSWSGDHQAATPEGSDVAGDDATTPQVRANECLVGALIGAMTGDLDRAEELAIEGLGLVSTIERDVPHARDTFELSRFMIRAFRGDATGARAIADGELCTARTAVSGATGVWLSVRSLQRLIDGDSSAALDDADEAVTSLVLGDAAGLRPLALAVQAVAHARLGDVGPSQAAAAAIEPGWRDDIKVQILLTQAAAWQSYASGDVAAAADLFAEAGRVGRATFHVPLGAIAAYDAVRIGAASAVTDELASATAVWSSPMSRAMAAHASLVAGPLRRDTDLAQLASLAAELGGLGLSLAGTQAWLQLADAAERAGRTDLVNRARLAALRSPLGDLAAPLAARPRLLTEREDEVARAVVAGRTSREVADGLGRSVRTVENHLAAIYRKLGVSNRQDLAEILVDVPGQVSPTSGDRPS